MWILNQAMSRLQSRLGHSFVRSFCRPGISPNCRKSMDGADSSLLLTEADSVHLMSVNMHSHGHNWWTSTIRILIITLMTWPDISSTLLIRIEEPFQEQQFTKWSKWTRPGLVLSCTMYKSHTQKDFTTFIWAWCHQYTVCTYVQVPSKQRRNYDIINQIESQKTIEPRKKKKMMNTKTWTLPPG
jgi:hypothetical protein